MLVRKASHNSLKLRPATIKDMLLVFRWSNDPLDRQMSFASQPITLSQHLRWFTKILNSSFRSLFIIEKISPKGNLPIGQVRYNLRTHELDIGLDKNWRGKRLATPTIVTSVNFLCHKFSCQKILALVKTSNLPALKAFSRAGFIVTSTALRVVALQWSLRPDTASLK